MTRRIDHWHEEILYENLVFSDDPEHLARYIEEGGELTVGLRNYLAKLLRIHAPKPRGKADRLRDLDVYRMVEDWRFDKSLTSAKEASRKAELNGEDGMLAFLDTPRDDPPPLQEAYRHFTKGDPEAKVDTFQKQYERGRAIYNHKK